MQLNINVTSLIICLIIGIVIGFFWNDTNNIPPISHTDTTIVTVHDTLPPVKVYLKGKTTIIDNTDWTTINSLLKINDSLKVITDLSNPFDFDTTLVLIDTIKLDTTTLKIHAHINPVQKTLTLEVLVTHNFKQTTIKETIVIEKPRNWLEYLTTFLAGVIVGKL